MSPVRRVFRQRLPNPATRANFPLDAALDEVEAASLMLIEQHERPAAELVKLRGDMSAARDILDSLITKEEE